MMVVGVLWALRLGGVAQVPVDAILAAALLVVGAGLLVSSVVGRARSLIVVGALLVPPVLAGQVIAAADLPAGVWNIESGRVGEITHTPTQVGELDSEYRLAAGSVRLDLSELDTSDAPRVGGRSTIEVDVQVGAGEIHVIVPDDAAVTATGRSGIGVVSLFGERNLGGLGAGPLEASRSPQDPAAGGPRPDLIELDLATGVGEVLVTVADG